MKKNTKLQLGKSSYLLIIASTILIFVLVAVFSYSMYGTKGTYSAEDGPGCYACERSGSTRYEWGNSNPNSTLCMKENDESKCGSACYVCERAGGRRYEWSTGNPNASVCMWQSDESKCLSDDDDDNDSGDTDTSTCWACKYGNSDDVSYREWGATNPKPNEENWLCYKDTSVTQTYCNNDPACWACKYGNSDDVSYRQWGATNPKAGNSNWLCYKDVNTSEANCKTGTDETPGDDPDPIPDNPPGGGGGGQKEIIPDNGVKYTETINGDRCYNGAWVRVTKCQAASVDGALCQLKDGTTVYRSSLTVDANCKDLSNAYSDTINDYRCDSRTSKKWIYISSCQPSSLVGAKCKTSTGTILRTDLTAGYGCSGSKPSGSSSSSSTTKKNVTSNPGTGTFGFIAMLVVGVGALIASIYYFGKNKTSVNKD